MIILDFPTDRGENAACQDREVSEWGGDNIVIATPGARRWAEPSCRHYISEHKSMLVTLLMNHNLL